MFRRTPLVAVALAVILAGCTERTSPDPLPEQPEPSAWNGTAPLGAHAARERLARRFALALRDPQFRNRLERELDRSPVREGKLHVQRYLSAADRREALALARASREDVAAVQADAARATPLEMYLPVPGHRSAWRGDDRILVATAHADHESPVAFTLLGERLVLDPRTPPAIPVLAVVPVETDFGAATNGGGGGGGGSSLPAGLYMTYAHFEETFEGWLKGSPEFEVHMLGQAGATDSLTSYSCAGEHAGGYYRFDQNDKNWSGNVLLMTQAQLNSYKSAHPDQNLRVFVVEDDDTSCQIKTDPDRFKNALKAVESAYPGLTGGKDVTSGSLLRLWKRATSLQKILKALASIIVTNDELVGNAVESTVVGESYPGANWIVKGENNKTNGWVNLIMR